MPIELSEFQIILILLTRCIKSTQNFDLSPGHVCLTVQYYFSKNDGSEKYNGIEKS